MAKRAHLFAVDWIPTCDDPATGGGLRSLQVLNALQDGGYTVSVSVPRHSGRVQKITVQSPGRIRSVLLHDDYNQLDLLREVRPDVVVWGWPMLRNIPFSGGMIHVCDMNGLQHMEIANGSGGIGALALERLIQRCLGADLILTGSPEQNGFWTGQLANAGQEFQTALVPYSLPKSFLRSEGAKSTVRGKTALRRLHFTGNLYNWSRAELWLPRVAEWAARHGGIELQVVAGLDPGGATGLQAIDQLNHLQRYPFVSLATEASFAAITLAYGPGSVALDLYQETLERRLAVPIRTVNALQHGIPIVSNVRSTLNRDLVCAGAALHVPANTDAAGGEDGLSATLDRLAAMSAVQLDAMAKAARGFAALHFDEAKARAALLEGIDHAEAARARSRAVWQRARPAGSQPGHVLAITDESPNLQHLRIGLPFSSMHRERLIEGYSIWRDGRIAFSTRAISGRMTFDALWVQRRLLPDMALTMQLLRRPYVFDADDNLLVSPAYRSAFPAEMMQSGRFLARNAAVLTAPSARLVEQLQRYAFSTLIHKAAICPNLIAPSARRDRPLGEPGCVVWASSDVPALSGSGLEIVRAVRDFCSTLNLKLVCIGAHPPAIIVESDVTVEHVGLLPYDDYLAFLTSLSPAIIVCPLETKADASTQDFIDGKSDIKILEALGTGLTGVFSAARPYLDTGLPKPILVENTYRGWWDGLMAARLACLSGDPAVNLPPDRIASGEGLRPWAEAIARVQLPQPLSLAEIETTLSLTRSRYTRRLLAEQDFDASWYEAQNPDVRSAIAAGHVKKAYEHYLLNGYRERRPGHADDMEAPGQDQFWLNLAHTVSDLRQSVESRSARLEEIRTRRAIRRRQRQPVL